MRSRTPDPIRVAAAAAVLLVLLLIGCQAPGSGTGAGATPVASADAALADRLEKLPTLPADIAATLDPKTNATKMADAPPAPVKLTGPLPHAPCCSIKDQRSLKVNVALTRCAPLRDFICRARLGPGDDPGGRRRGRTRRADPPARSDRAAKSAPTSSTRSTARTPGTRSCA